MLSAVCVNLIWQKHACFYPPKCEDCEKNFPLIEFIIIQPGGIIKKQPFSGARGIPVRIWFMDETPTLPLPQKSEPLSNFTRFKVWKGVTEHGHYSFHARGCENIRNWLETGPNYVADVRPSTWIKGKRVAMMCFSQPFHCKIETKLDL